ncbi:hypothetical protein COU57_02650 [Candidatus Pacearchaeota archaeon CG10_big_fil_rev_8_21_14_0_10_32_14]|nr:MAG: hypothetical protein COU57_02650 [Candidatus Pacearchaeota archaeon CG10_big_fil_rev_8_21_14_0_10_32_14]
MIISTNKVSLCMEHLKEISPRQYQQDIFETAKNFNTLIVLPTGMGKTLIALMLSAHRLEKFPDKKIVFLAPTRPLAEQHLNYFKKHLSDLFGDIQLFTGKVTAKDRKKIFQTADIIFSTPQCIGNDVKNGLYDLEDVSLLIEDESHRCLKNYAYNYVAKKYHNQTFSSPWHRIIGMTASPGSDKQKVSEICKNLHIEKVEIRSREDEDVKKYLQKLEFEKIEVDFPPRFEEIRILLKEMYNKYIDELKHRSLLFKPPTKINLIELQNRLFLMTSKGNNNFNVLLGISACASAIKIQHAMELLETQTLTSFDSYLKKLFKEASQGKSKGVQKLVAKPEFNVVYTMTSELMIKKIEHPKVERIRQIVSQEFSRFKDKKPKIIIFTQYRETATILSKDLNITLKHLGVKSKVFVGQSKKMIGGETIGLSQVEQKGIITDFSEGTTNIIVSTSIGEEGLDIPEVNSVIFYEPVPSAIRKIQRAGRTARLMKGKLIILVTKKTRDESYYWSAFHKEKKMYSAIQSITEDIESGKINFSDENKFEKQKTLI